MASPAKTPSNIQRYFSGSSIFVTGATGVLGRLLIEKLLWSCDLDKVYILLRQKKSKSCDERFQEYFNDFVFERLRKERPETIKKLFAMEGNCELPELGLNEQNKAIIFSEVNFIFHCAATVRFDEKLSAAVKVNIEGTQAILKIAKKMKNLKSLIYVSTAFSFCPKQEIDELFYEPPMTGDELLTLVKKLTEEQLEEITPRLIGEWPNSYTFSKSVAEDVVKKEGSGLPIAIVRPSVVVSTHKEPVTGWIDSFNGPTGLFLGIHLMGLIRTMNCNCRYRADVVPADFVVNCMIAAAWDVARDENFDMNQDVLELSGKNSKSDIPIYNYTNTPQNPLTWDKILTVGSQYAESVSSPLQVWHCIFFECFNKYVYLFLHYTLHMLPAYTIDLLLTCVGKESQCVKTYKKIEKYLNVIQYFGVRQWFFQNNNTQRLWAKLSTEDKDSFEFDISVIDWESFIKSYILGARIYLLKDPVDTIPKGRAKRFKLKIAHYTLVAVLVLGTFMLLKTLFNILW